MRVPPTCLSIVLVLLTLDLFAADGESVPPDAPASASWLSPSEFSRIKRNIRLHIDKKTKQRITVPEIPEGEAANHWVALGDYERAGNDRSKLYALFRQHLAVVDALLRQEDPKARRSGLGIAVAVATATMQKAEDPELAIQIADAYLMTNLEIADTKHWQYLSRETVLKTAIMVYGEAGANEKLLAAARIWKSEAHNQNTADAARFRAAQALEGLSRFDEAIVELEEISDATGMAGAKRRIPELRKKLEEASKVSKSRGNGDAKPR